MYKLCPLCRGRGVTEETAPSVRQGYYDRYGNFVPDEWGHKPSKASPFVTVAQGSGCPRCLGLGTL